MAIYDRRWMARGVPHEVIERESVFENLDLKNKLILDLGAGTLRFSLDAIERGARRAVGLDSLREMLEWGIAKAKALGMNGKIDVIVADVRHLPLLNDAFEIAIAIELFEHIPEDKELFVSEVYRVLKKSGVAVINTWNAIPRVIASVFGYARKQIEFWKGRFYYHFYYPWEFKRFMSSATFEETRILGVHSAYFVPILERLTLDDLSKASISLKLLCFLEITIDRLFRKFSPLNQITGLFLLAVLRK
jgi:ubiquinone/menaquinone biosynthesis C-methylase UbiE